MSVDRQRWRAQSLPCSDLLRPQSPRLPILLCFLELQKPALQSVLVAFALEVLVAFALEVLVGGGEGCCLNIKASALILCRPASFFELNPLRLPPSLQAFERTLSLSRSFEVPSRSVFAFSRSFLAFSSPFFSSLSALCASWSSRSLPLSTPLLLVSLVFSSRSSWLSGW